MKNTIRLIALAVAIVAGATAAYAQVLVIPGTGSDYPQEWTAMKCHPKIKVRAKISAFNQTGPNSDGRYTIFYQVINTDPVNSVSFEYSVGSTPGESNQKISEGDTRPASLGPNKVLTDWNQFTSDKGIFFDVGYLKTAGSGSSGFDGCQTAANPVDRFCYLKPKAGCPGLEKIKEERAKLEKDPEARVLLTNASYGNGPVAAEIPCGDPADENIRAASDIKERILQNLRANITTISLEQAGGAMYTIQNPSITASGETITIRFTQRFDSKDGFNLKEGEEVSWWQQDLIQTISFAGLASTLKERPAPAAERNAPYLSKTDVRWLAIEATKDSQNYSAYKLNLVPGPPRGPIYGLPYDMGSANANYKELGKLLAQLKAIPKPAPGRVTVPCKEEAEKSNPAEASTAPSTQRTTPAAVPSAQSAPSSAGSAPGKLPSPGSRVTREEMKRLIVDHLRVKLTPGKQVLAMDSRVTQEVSEIFVNLEGDWIVIDYAFKLVTDAGISIYRVEGRGRARISFGRLHEMLSAPSVLAFFTDSRFLAFDAESCDAVLTVNDVGAAWTCAAPPPYDKGPNSEDYDALLFWAKQYHQLNQ